MRSGRLSIALPTASLLFLILTAACSLGGLGYGIILWAPADTPLDSSRVVKIISESTIEETYIVEDSLSGEKYTIPRWRVELAGSKKADAEAAAESYAPYANLMALSRQTGLPIREKPDAQSDRVYRLRSEEEIKILSRSESQVQVGSFTGYWYKVITEDGTLGYVFDQNLVIYEEGTRDEALAVSNYDPRLDDFFTRRYYPERYLHLIEKGTVDLATINPSMGLIPDQENGSVSIVSPRYSVESEYSAITSAGSNRYYFADTTLYIMFENPEPPVESLIAQFRAAGNDISARFVAIPDIEEILEKERERREEVLLSLIEDGGSFVSSAYGRLTVDELGGFVWEGKERLVPAVLKERYGNRGTIRFDRFLSPALASSYDGAATFRFDGAASNEAVTFLFNREPQGLRLTLVPEENVTDLVVQQIGFNPLVLFMSRQE